MAQARAILTACKDDYNFTRPHSGLRNLPPALYAKRLAITWGGTLELNGGSAPAPLRTSRNIDYLAPGLSQ